MKFASYLACALVVSSVAVAQYAGGAGRSLDVNGGTGQVPFFAGDDISVNLTDNGTGTTGGTILLIGVNYAPGTLPVPFAAGSAIDMTGAGVLLDGVGGTTGPAAAAIASQPSFSLTYSNDGSLTDGPYFQAAYFDAGVPPFNFDLTACAGGLYDPSIVTVIPGSTLPDDGSATHTLTNTINYCGGAYTTVYLGTNGQITFGAGSGDFSTTPGEFSAGWQLSPTTTPNPGVAGVWGDFNRAGSGGDMTIVENTLTGDTTIQYNNQQWWNSITPAGSWSTTFTALSVVHDLTNVLDGVNGTDQNGIVGLTDGDDTIGQDNAITVANGAGYTTVGAGPDTIYQDFDHLTNLLSGVGVVEYLEIGSALAPCQWVQIQ